MRFLQQERARFEEAKQEAAQLRAKLDNYKAVEMVVKGAEGDVNLMLAERGESRETQTERGQCLLQIYFLILHHFLKELGTVRAATWRRWS